jgi:plastocyanin
MIRTFLVACVTVVGLASACTDNSGNGQGNPGAGGSSAGSGGTTGTGGSNAGTAGTGGSGGSGGSSAGGTGGTSAGGAGGTTTGFMSVLPCTSESAYVTGTTVSFPTAATDFSYNPKCLKVSAGATVTFSGDFLTHPLTPSANRGAQTGSPITVTSSGTSKAFTFATPGFYAYYCAVHDFSDTGNFMDGVVWVQ